MGSDRYYIVGMEAEFVSERGTKYDYYILLFLIFSDHTVRCYSSRIKINPSFIPGIIYEK